MRAVTKIDLQYQNSDFFLKRVYCESALEGLQNTSIWDLVHMKSRLAIDCLVSGLQKSQDTTRQCPIRNACPHQNGWIFGKLPNGLWLTPRPRFGKLCCPFFREVLKYATKFFRIGVCPPHPPFPKICNGIFQIGETPPFPKICRFSPSKDLQQNVLDREWPPPGSFPKIHPFWWGQSLS